MAGSGAWQKSDDPGRFFSGPRPHAPIASCSPVHTAIAKVDSALRRGRLLAGLRT